MYSLPFFVLGVGQAFTQVPSTEPLFWYFPNNFATVNGISLAGGAVGMMILPPLSERLLNAFGWRGSIALLAVVSLNVVVVGAILKRPKWTKHQNTHSNKTNSQCSLQNAFAAIRKKLNFKLFTTYPIFTLFQVICLLNGVLYTTWVLFLVPDAVSRGFSLTKAVYLSTIGGVGFIIGRIGNGILIDWKLISDINLYTVLMAILAASVSIGTLARTFWVLSVLAFTVGICLGAQYPLAMLLAKAQVEEERWAMSAIAWTYLFQGTGNSLAGLITGKCSSLWKKQRCLP